jgi:hypothetical protein
MEKVCAIVDAQGFNFEDRFVARELAICSDGGLTLCQELNPHMDFKSLSPSEKDTVIHSTKFIHGLFYCPFNHVEHAFLPHSNDIGPLLKLYYNMIATTDKPLFAFKNKSLKAILNEQEIPSLDLDDPNCKFPSLQDIENAFGDRYACGYHKKPPRDGRNIAYRCAYRKCANIWRYIKQQLQDLS